MPCGSLELSLVGDAADCAPSPLSLFHVELSHVPGPGMSGRFLGDPGDRGAPRLLVGEQGALPCDETDFIDRPDWSRGSHLESSSGAVIWNRYARGEVSPIGEPHVPSDRGSEFGGDVSFVWFVRWVGRSRGDPLGLANCPPGPRDACPFPNHPPSRGFGVRNGMPRSGDVARSGKRSPFDVNDDCLGRWRIDPVFAAPRCVGCGCRRILPFGDVGSVGYGLGGGVSTPSPCSPDIVSVAARTTRSTALRAWLILLMLLVHEFIDPRFSLIDRCDVCDTRRSLLRGV